MAKASDDPGTQEMFPGVAASERPRALEVVSGKLATKLIRARTTLGGRQWALSQLQAQLTRLEDRRDRIESILDVRERVARKKGDIRRSEDEIASLEAEVKADPAWRG